MNCFRLRNALRRWTTRVVVAVLLGAAMGVLDAAGQRPATPPDRPRIGLVLEGGGALGFAHIGVIEWLEQHHIPVDDVAGTSMGGLVGGLYASGNSPSEIQKFVGDIDWAAVLSGQVQFKEAGYRRKEDNLAYPNRLVFGLKHGVSLPNGLNSGAAVGMLLDRTMLPYYNLKSFDDLPIRFRCVATDMTTGTAHVFEDGSLAQALRSTMSIPGVFAPVTHGTQVFSDGAAVDNLPVDVARKMGAQVVIAVYLDTGKFDVKDLNSLLGVAGRNVSIMVANNERESMKNADILLKADVSKFSSTAFEESAKIIPQGYKVAEAHAAELEKYALNDADWKAYVTARDARRRTEVPVPQFVDIYGLKGAQQAEVADEFTKYVGKPVDPQAVEKTIDGLQGMGTYSSVSYNMIEKDGKTGLLIRPRPKNYGPPFLNVGLTMSSNNTDNFNLGMGGRATFMDVAGPRSELRVDASMGQVASLKGELYAPLAVAPRYFVAPRAYLVHTTSAYFNGSSQLAEYREKRNGFGVDFGYQINPRAEVRVGEDYQWYAQVRAIGEPVAHEFRLTPWVTSLRFQYLGQDEVQLPSHGSIVQSSLRHYTERPNGSGGFTQMDTYLAHFIPLAQRSIFFGVARGGTSFRKEGLGLAGFALGGPLRLSAYSRGELLGDDYFLGQTGYLFRLTKVDLFLGQSMYAGGFYEIGKVWNGATGTPSLPNDISGLLVMKTLVGPLYGGVSIGDSDHRKWFFGLGRIF
ncbi:MAG: patatin-like phospholipase family protein [Edaphobacter sp.]